MLFLRRFEWSEPTLGQGGDKILIIIVGLEAIKGEEVRPGGRGFRLAGMDPLKQIICNSDMAGAKIADKTHGASMKLRSLHILALLRLRLPLGNLSSILELRFYDIAGTAPRMSVDKSTEARFGPSPALRRDEMRGLARNFIVERDGMTKGKEPGGQRSQWLCSGHQRVGYIMNMQVVQTVIIFSFCHAVVMMATHATVLDPLALEGELSTKFLLLVDAIVHTVPADLNTSSSSLTFKAELGLDGFSSRETKLAHAGKLGAGGLAEDGAATKRSFPRAKNWQPRREDLYWLEKTRSLGGSWLILRTL